jgi:predicted TIM-barrel fold metal-dependent hydrolase
MESQGPHGGGLQEKLLEKFIVAHGSSYQNKVFSTQISLELLFVLLMSDVPHLFPHLRWGFIEASAQWVPWIYNEVARRYETDGKRFPEDVFQAYKVFVTCQTDDDLPWILKYAGEHSLVIGTDYGHTDPSSELDAISVLRQMDGISQETKDRILSHNPKALYNL